MIRLLWRCFRPFDNHLLFLRCHLGSSLIKMPYLAKAMPCCSISGDEPLGIFGWYFVPIITIVSTFCGFIKIHIQKSVCYSVGAVWNMSSTVCASSIHSRLCMKMSSIIFIMLNSISGLDAWYHFRFNISCGVAVMVRGHKKNQVISKGRGGARQNKFWRGGPIFEVVFTFEGIFILEVISIF